MNIIFKKINKLYESDPNIAKPKIEVSGSKVSLFFPLNYFVFNFKEGEYGKIIFHDCLMFRVGDPNDEGLLMLSQQEVINDSVWSLENFPEIEVNSFFEIENSDWSSILKHKGFINSDVNIESIDRSKYKHFVFFMKDGTFECVCSNFEEEIPIN